MELENAMKITEDYYLTSDGKRNFILNERYAKREGRGKDAPLSGEFAYREVGYFQNYEHVGNHLKEKVNFQYHGSEFEATAIRVEKAKDEIVAALIKYADLKMDKEVKEEEVKD